MGRISKVDSLPYQIRSNVVYLIKTLNHKEALEAVNALIESSGLPDECKLSRSSLSRYRVDKLNM
ncbi:TPA: DUF3486 family protein [Vibrio parahaemolyticus]|nr:DUF3486 family protein [Vibrio parahaemolyticus]HBC3882074.1 DUF3486 family protein [Vibrio parahaemolyticus]HBC3906620.1 DUF3486 family protein [Vibrio parahaemolyticus]